MNRTTELIEMAKKQQGIESDNGLAVRLGMSRALIAHWKKGRAKPDIANFAKLAHAAGLTMDDALPYVVEVDRESRNCILC